MLDQIVNSLKEQVGDSLMEKVGLNKHQSDSSINAAGASVVDLLSGGNDLDLGDVLTLFSKQDNNSGAEDVLGKLGETFVSKLKGDVGLSSEKAGSVSTMVLPMLMSLLSDKVGGDKSSLSSVLGNLAGGILGGTSSAQGTNGLLGSVSKLFGK